MSGYSFQYDPGYANVNAGFGKALLLRLWENGKECGTPIAKVRVAEGARGERQAQDRRCQRG